MKILFKTFCLYLLTTTLSDAQNTPIGQWKIHLPYTDAMSVTEAKNRIYCATSKGLFFYDKNDNRVETLSKTSGLSDLVICGTDTSTTNHRIGGVKYNSVVDELLICYVDCNIDIIKGGTQIINLSDILRKSIPGKKTINAISFNGDIAYLSCSFGIVVLNMATLEIEDTYYVGTGVTNRQILDVTTDGTNLYAATDSGLYRASLSDPEISYYAAWSYVNVNPNCTGANCPLIFDHLAYFNNEVIANCTFKQTNTDTSYAFNGISWSEVCTGPSSIRKDYFVCYNKLLITDQFGVNVYDLSFNRINLLYGYSIPIDPFQGILDKDNYAWIADNGSGLVRITPDNRYEKIFPNGPATNNVWSMDIQNNNLWVAPGGYTGVYAPSFNVDGLFTYQNSTWQTFNHNNYTPLNLSFHDFTNVAINPTNSSQVFFGSWGSGIVEFDNNSFNKSYNTSNSSLKAFPDSGVYIGGLAFDTVGDLWVGNARCNNLLSVKTNNNKWYGYNIPAWSAVTTELTSVMVDPNNYIWEIFRAGDIGVFNYNNTFDITTDDQSTVLSTTIGQGHLPGPAQCMATDQNGAVWVGTQAGVAVFYSPGSIFTPNTNYDCQQIIIVTNGNAQYLLGAEVVTAIAVDGANQKWFGTQTGGVYLMSADGLTQIYHFDITNSPLLSNDILSIKINQKTGEVFFGTSQGIVSFKGTATEGNSGCDVFIYPNPVRASYTGTIGIKGLMSDMIVKITDITGTLVYETTAQGGQAIWNGTNFKGIRPATGVYLVFCSSADGTQSCTGKLLFIN